MNKLNKKLVEIVKKQNIGLIQKMVDPRLNLENKNKVKKPNLLGVDKNGKTILFYAVETGNLKIVKLLIFSLVGTGIKPQRLSLLQIKDNERNTAEDIANKRGFKKIRELLGTERYKMEIFE